jgi:hypothetical protein
MTYSKAPLEDVLDALMLEESDPNYKALLRWSERYPEHRDALATFFATWATQAELPQETVGDQERLANLGVSHALDILHRRDEAGKRAPKAAGARARLIATARTLGLSPEQLAMRTRLDVSIIEKLDLRRIKGGIPRLCVEWLAETLGIVTAQIQDMTIGSPLAAVRAHHKTKSKPTLTTEDFSDAIRNSALSEETKQFWLDAVASERESGTE